MRSKFATSVDQVLQDGTALNAFEDWIKLDPTRCGDIISLHLAIKVYKSQVAKGGSTTIPSLRSTHRKYISPRTGTCTFLPESVRQEMSTRVHAVLEQNDMLPSQSLFDPVRSPLMKQLKIYHSQFIMSEQFQQFVRSIGSADDEVEYAEPATCSTHQDERISQTQDEMKVQRGSKSRSQSDASSSRIPYVDDIIDFPRVDPCQTNKEGYRHDTLEGQDRFVRDLTLKLNEYLYRLEKKRNGAKDIISPLFPTTRQRVIEEETASDEDTDRYIDRLEQRKRSASASPVLFNTKPYPSDPYQSDISYPPFPSVPPPAFPPFRHTPYGGANGFAPPPKQSQIFDFNNVQIPTALMNTSQKSRRGTTDYRRSDSSGFCSAESAFMSSERSYGNNNIGWEKSNVSYPIGSAHTLLRRPHIIQTPNQHIFATLPRRPIDNPPTTKLTMVLRERGHPPMVAHVAPTNGVVCLSEFRRTFGISRKENRKFLFKSACEEDESSAFQWSVISDESQPLPLYEGKIDAECRLCSDSE